MRRSIVFSGVRIPVGTPFQDEPSPGPVKALPAARGECANELRAPMTVASPGLIQRLAALVAQLTAA